MLSFSEAVFSVSVTAGIWKPSRVSRTFDELRMCPPSELLLSALQHSLAQRLEARSAIRLSLEQLESGHVSLHGPLTPFERESGFHGIVVSFQSLSKVFEF